MKGYERFFEQHPEAQGLADRAAEAGFVMKPIRCRQLRNGLLSMRLVWRKKNELMSITLRVLAEK